MKHKISNNQAAIEYERLIKIAIVSEISSHNKRLAISATRKLGKEIIRLQDELSHIKFIDHDVISKINSRSKFNEHF